MRMQLIRLLFVFAGIAIHLVCAAQRDMPELIAVNPSSNRLGITVDGQPAVVAENIIKEYAYEWKC